MKPPKQPVNEKRVVVKDTQRVFVHTYDHQTHIGISSLWVDGFPFGRGMKIADVNITITYRPNQKTT